MPANLLPSKFNDTHAEAWLYTIYIHYIQFSSVAQSCPTLCDPMNRSMPGLSVHGILQARTLEWVPSPPPGELPDLVDQAGSLQLMPPGKPFIDPQFSSVQFSCSVMSNSLQTHESQHARPPCPSPTPGVHSDSHPSSQ